MISFSKNILEDWQKRGIEKITCKLVQKGCEGNKIEILETETPGLMNLHIHDRLTLTIDNEDYTLLDGSMISLVEKKWIVKSLKIDKHCSCGSSFSLKEDIKKKADLKEKLKGFKYRFQGKD